MKYAVLNGGKRLRPILLFMTLDILGCEREKGLATASAIEMIHSYSLVHDDLPALDNDDYRRGKLTTHKKFGEAEGILIGDALLTHAFYVLTEKNSHLSADKIVEIVKLTCFNRPKEKQRKDESTLHWHVSPDNDDQAILSTHLTTDT